jgi:hypothetical protein
VIAVEDLGAEALQGRQPAPQPADDRGQPVRRVPDQGRRRARLDVGQLGVDRLDRHRDLGGRGLVGGVDRPVGAADDQAHQIDAGREQQFAAVLPAGGPVEQAVEGRGVEGRFQGRPRRHGDRGLLDEAVKEFAE